MCNPTPKRYDLLKHLRILFKILNYFALTGISFNPAVQRFERPQRKRITNFVYTITFLLSGALFLRCITKLLHVYVATSKYDSVQSVQGQERVISEFSGYVQTASAFIYALLYFRIEHRLLALFNEGLQIFKWLEARTGPGLFISSKLFNVLVIKAVLLASKMRFTIAVSIFMLGIGFINVDYIFFPVLCVLMVFSYIYVQLTLLCFYVKMTEHLEAFGTAMERRKLMQCLRAFISVSRRIHTLKERLHSFTDAVFMCTYMGLFHDIQFIYMTLKTIFYSKYFSDQHPWWKNCCFFPTCLLYSLDVFIISILSDMLEDANDKFQATVVKLSECTPSLRREVDIMLMGDNVCGLGCRALGQIKVNQEFSFQFTINIVMVFVITFLQFFAAEQIYTKNFVKLTIGDEFESNL